MKKMTSLALICILAASCSDYETTSSNHSSAETETTQSSAIPEEDRLTIEKKNGGFQIVWTDVSLELRDGLLYSKRLIDGGLNYSFELIEDYTVCCAPYMNVDGNYMAAPQNFDGTLSLLKGFDYELVFYVRTKEEMTTDNSEPTGLYRYYAYKIDRNLLTINGGDIVPSNSLRQAYCFRCEDDNKTIAATFNSETYEFRINGKTYERENKKHTLSAYSIGMDTIYVNPMKKTFVEGEEVEVAKGVVFDADYRIMCNDFIFYPENEYSQGDGLIHSKIAFPPFDITLYCR